MPSSWKNKRLVGEKIVDETTYTERTNRSLVARDAVLRTHFGGARRGVGTNFNVRLPRKQYRETTIYAVQRACLIPRCARNSAERAFAYYTELPFGN